MNNLFENKVVKTEEDYKAWHGELVTWRIALVSEFATLGLLLLLGVSTPKIWDWADSPCVSLLATVGLFLLVFILGNFTSMLHDLQTSTQHTIDARFDPGGEAGWRFEGIFTTRGIKLAQLELRRYRRHKRNREKERNQERQELEADRSGK